MTRLIHSRKSTKVKLYGKPRFVLQGVRNNCSAAMITNVSFLGASTATHAWASAIAPDRFKPIKSVREYFTTYNGSVYKVPLEYAMLYILETAYLKATTGSPPSEQITGNEEGKMWASPSYCTRTFFVSDRVHERGTLGTYGFMKWVKSKGASVAGAAHMSRAVAGAHGGKVQGMVWTPGGKDTIQTLQDAVQRLNGHAEAVWKNSQRAKAAAELPKATDEVGKLW
jgi:hypothetical protein